MVSAIIVAAGKGTRMGPDRDKLFLEIAGRPVVAHTWKRFDRAKEIDEIVVVVRDGMQSGVSGTGGAVCAFETVPAGGGRGGTAGLGVERVAGAEAGIGDCGDPGRGAALHERGNHQRDIAAARETGAAVAAQPVTDTIKESADGRVDQPHLDRGRLWSVQTPQTFRAEIIRHALLLVREKGLQVTDDTAACELIGQPVKLVAGGAPESQGNGAGGPAVYGIAAGRRAGD